MNYQGTLAAIIASVLLSFTLIFFNPLLVFFSDPGRLGELPLRFVLQQFLVAAGLALALALPSRKLGRR